MPSFGQDVTRAATILLMCAGLCTADAFAADLGTTNRIYGFDPAPLVRYDAYGYPVYAAAAVHAIAPADGSLGCAAGLQPVYDASGNSAGYSPIRICR